MNKKIIKNKKRLLFNYRKKRRFTKRKIVKIDKKYLENISKIAQKESIFFNPNDCKYELNSRQVKIQIRDNKIIHIEKKIESIIQNRYEVLLSFIKSVLEDRKYRIHGDFIFNLGDMDDHNQTNEIVFSKNKNTKKSLMPDSYAMGGYRNVPQKKDKKPFLKKSKKGYFIGTSTGNMNPIFNDRLIFANHNSSLFKCELNHICQIPIHQVKNTYPEYSKFILNKNKTIEEQRDEYRYIMDIDGNTCSWDRIVWIMKSNCICLKKKSDNMNWYYPLLVKDLHYYEFNTPEELNDLIKKLNRMSKKNRLKIRKNIKESKNFVSNYLGISSHLHYFGQLLHYISEKFID